MDPTTGLSATLMYCPDCGALLTCMEGRPVHCYCGRWWVLTVGGGPTTWYWKLKEHEQEEPLR